MLDLQVAFKNINYKPWFKNTIDPYIRMKIGQNI